MYVFLRIPDLLVIIHASSSYSPSTTIENMCALDEKMNVESLLRLFRSQLRRLLNMNRSVRKKKRE